MRSLLEDFLVSEGHAVQTYARATDALEALKKTTSGFPDLVVTDIKMPLMDGMTFLEKVKETAPGVPVILMTAFGSIESAIEAIRRGAFDYITKPFKLAEIGVTVNRAIEFGRLKKDNTSLRNQLKQSFSMGEMLGKSPAMKRVFDLVTRVARANSNVLIQGESGTGKEMVARAVHRASSRASEPFVAINCSAIPEALLESELFGHAKGAFTGAISKRRGLFEEATGGTLFLDEIGDMDMMLQAKLLRVLQERKIKAVGENAYRDVDVRIIAATHKDLKKAVKDGEFREDLFYRLSVIPVELPPLRERAEDIPLLADHFLQKYAAANGVELRGFSKGAMARMMAMRWEGNVRELENLVERMVVLSGGPVIEEGDIPGAAGSDDGNAFFEGATSDFPTIEELERRYIERVLQKTGGRKDKASEILGINRRTLYRKEREYGLVENGDSEPTDETVSGERQRVQ